MIVLVMGVAGSGKTTVGRALAQALKFRFVDADDFHPPANVEKMSRGLPLDEADRAPWLDAVAAQLHGDVVLACSALKAAHRARLRPTHLVWLQVPTAELAERLATRAGHFFNAALLPSQLASLEVPDDALTVDATQRIDDCVLQILAALRV